MSEDQHLAIRQMLESHNTITLATASEEGPWAASVFYASDKDFNLYFVSDYRTRHARDMAGQPDVVVTVNADCAEWTGVKGLQIAGQATTIDGLQRVNALRHYLLKFSDVKALFERPKDQNEETIAKRLKAANMYCLKPRWIRLIDNSKWFGYKFEYNCESGEV
ncbi:MAG: pyridoxamine 5'-phosphate oxidase family protein [Gammaproteobacteria bacterium]|nr:pyridoxamine 5'-phosphate oxidase family protein [Gammaproteobacteria bacterium]